MLNDENEAWIGDVRQIDFLLCFFLWLCLKMETNWSHLTF